MSSPVVYVAQEVLKRTLDGERIPAFDLTPASEYGELRIVVPYGVFTGSENLLIKIISDNLKDYTARDYLLAVGDPTVVAISAMVASSVTNGLVNLLKWDRRMHKYIPVHIDLLTVL